MDLQKLREAGGIVSNELVKKNIKWVRKIDDVEETLDFDVFIKRSRYGEIERIQQSEEGRSRLSMAISQCVFLGEEGKEQLTYEDAYDLAPTLATAFMIAIHEVNGTSGKPKN